MQAFLEGFKDPDSSYRIMPFWFWNSRINEAEVRFQIRAFKQMGVGGFFIHARFGLETEYLSAAWMDLVEIAVREAAELGLEVWLYDENLFPSGIGNTAVSRCMEYRPKYIEYAFFRLDQSQGGSNICLSALPAGCQPFSVQDIADGRAARNLAFRVDDSIIRIEGEVGSVEQVAIFWLNTLQDDKDLIFGVDYLNPDTLSAFLESTHEPYKKRLEPWFGNVIKGFFTDEPTLIPWHHDIKWYKDRKNGFCIPYTHGLLEVIHRAGLPDVDLGTLAAAIFFDSPDQEQTSLVRNIYWNSVSELYAKGFFKAYADWCENNNLMLTGHVLLEEGLYFNHIFQAGPLEGLRYMHIPGVDQLGSGSEYPNMNYMVEDLPHIPRVRTNVTGPKLVSSIAHITGRRRVLSESFGVGGWPLQFQQMKAILDWEFALGVNLLCPHAFFYSIEGYRKFDAPPCHYHNTNAGLYRIFADYAARMSFALSQGDPVADTAVIYPSSGFRSAYAVGRQRSDDRLVSDAYDFACAALLRLHRGYEIVSENQLAIAKVKSGRLSLENTKLTSRLMSANCDHRHLAFTTVIIPSMQSMDSNCQKVLGRFIRSGGKVLVLSDAADPKRQAGNGSGDNDSINPELTQACVMNQLSAFFAQVQYEGSSIRITGAGEDRIYTLCRQVADARLWFVANTDKDKRFLGQVDFRCSKIILLNAETGGYLEKSGDWMTLDLAPAGSLLILAVGKPCASEKPSTIKRQAVTRFKVDRKNWSFICSNDNALPIDKWEFRVYASGMQMEYHYKATVESDLDLPLAYLILDDIENRASIMGQSHQTISCNSVACSLDGTYLDKGFKKYLISNIQAGKNTIEIHISHSAWSGEPHPLTMTAVLTGKFALRKHGSGHRWVLIQMPMSIKLALWTRQGFPFYSGCGIYSRKLQFPDFSRLHIRLEHIEGGARMSIDGIDLGTRLWAPWEWDVPTSLSGREVEISLEITNTLANYLGIQHDAGPSGWMMQEMILAKHEQVVNQEGGA